MLSTAMRKQLSILIADDHPMILAGVAAVIGSEGRLSVAGQASNGKQAIDLFCNLRPDVVLLDLRMPECSGLEAIEGILAIDPQARIVILSSFDGEEDVFNALQAGAKAYVLKDASKEELVDALLLAAEGRRSLAPRLTARLLDRLDREPLSNRELEILQLVARGKSNKVIGAATRVTESTIKFHVTNIMEKLGASNRMHAVNIACNRGILRLEDCPGAATSTVHDAGRLSS
jgi:two-component system, NarL family, response regulator